jgi:coenzyme F420-0:L-glutamate ligase/coenzyme F420-1:gamma-L-glutamate ligase
VSLLITPLALAGAVRAGDDLITLLEGALAAATIALLDGDVVVVTSKIVSKSEGRVVPVGPEDADKVRLVESEARRVLRRRGTLRITETHHGFVNANAGIDLSNTDEGTAVLLPVDPDRSARRLRADIGRRLGVEVGVVITDTFGRAWRQGVCDVAIGSAGVTALLDLRGTRDANGRLLEATEVAIADEVAAAANLVMGKAASTPLALLRGLDATFFGPGSVGEDLVRRPHDDLFR